MNLWLIGTVLFLAYTNGANDNFKGVATLFGSRTASRRSALWWATGTTLAGSCAAVFLAGHLVKAFTGKGLVPDVFTADPGFLPAVGLGAALTVLLATLTGWPISTTHSLTGALVGAGVMAAGAVNLARLGTEFFLPLALSPLISVSLTGLIYPTLRFMRRQLGVQRHLCLCLDGEPPAAVHVHPDGSVTLASSGVRLSVGELAACSERYQGQIWGFDAQALLDRLHFLSAGAVSFARGLNDTPKIVALLVAAHALNLSLTPSFVAVGLAMAIGGLLHSRPVALTMSERITSMNHGQGFTANLVTAFLVVCASRWGLPVSTTHVSCGSLFGLGAVTGQGHWKMIRAILLSWLVTPPLAAVLAAMIYGFQ